ncbi:THO complex subunit 4A-like [Actinidia eriantha]|uniref:THO complex subunit 4A-like n=1 Tax=Actinidia eriantha TaxID=165200 RepID=UPI002586776E|nr:THO complex subunit 4A-like [Actinidia eriantha]
MAALDMTLDDLIKTNKKSGGGGGNFRGRGRAPSGPGPARRFPNRGANRPAPYTTRKAMAYAGQTDGRVSSIETGTKLYISNLDYGVSNEDIKELFSEVGDLKRYTIHYDRSGRSKGTAEIVYSRRQDAQAAVKRYNNVQLDGKPMKVEIVGTNIVTPPPMPASANGSFRNFNGVPRSGQGRGGAQGRPRGGGRGGGFGRGRGQGRGHGEKISAEDLDAELEKYHSEAMQIN